MALSFTNLLRNLRSTVASGRLVRNHRRSRTCGAATRFPQRLEALEDRRLLTFGVAGIVTTDIAPDAGDWVEAVAIQPDGKIVAAGPGGLCRYNADGSLDATFSGDGIVAVPGHIADLEIQADGKIVVGGNLVVGGNGDFMVRRFNTDGSPDLTFDGDGVVTLDFKNGSRDFVNAIALQAPDANGQQKIVAVGYYDTGWSASEKWTVLRYNANGTLDSTFDGDGKLTTAFGKGTTNKAIPNGVMMQPDGKILVVGEAVGSDGWFDYAMARYNTNGTLDSSFGQGGKVMTDFRAEHNGLISSDGARDVARQADGKLVVVGRADAYFAIARYDQSGKLDTSFAGDGKQILASPVGDGGNITFKSVAIQPQDQKIVVGGSGHLAYVARFNSIGALDTSFDGDGWQAFRFSDPSPNPHSAGDVLALQSDGKIVMGGAAESPTGDNFAVARLNPDGSFDAAAPLTAAGSPAANPSVNTFTQEQLPPILAEAIARWQGPGVDTLPLANVTVQIVDLADGYLGMADGNTIYLDDNAAGWGWFVDATPQNDLEFVRLGNQSESAAADMDLLTVVMHELGHLLDYDHDQEGVMRDQVARPQSCFGAVAVTHAQTPTY